MEKITLTLDLSERTLDILRELLLRQKAADAPAVAPEEVKAEPKTKAKPQAEPKTEAKPQEEPKTEAKPQEPTKTDVRALALKLSKAGKQNELKAIFQKYGAEKLSAIPESDYPALLQDLEAANG